MNVRYLIAVIEGIEQCRSGINRLIDRGFERLMKAEDPFGIVCFGGAAVCIIVSLLLAVTQR